MDLVVGINYKSILLNCTAPLNADTNVIVVTLDAETPYERVPWLCVEAVAYQRRYEMMKAFAQFGISKVLIMDYPTEDSVDVDRLFAELQMRVLLMAPSTMYYECAGFDRSGKFVIQNVCDAIKGVANKIRYSGYSKEEYMLTGSQLWKKYSALCEIKEEVLTSGVTRGDLLTERYNATILP